MEKRSGNLFEDYEEDEITVKFVRKSDGKLYRRSQNDDEITVKRYYDPFQREDEVTAEHYYNPIDNILVKYLSSEELSKKKIYG